MQDHKRKEVFEMINTIGKGLYLAVQASLAEVSVKDHEGNKLDVEGEVIEVFVECGNREIEIHDDTIILTKEQEYSVTAPISALRITGYELYKSKRVPVKYNGGSASVHTLAHEEKILGVLLAHSEDKLWPFGGRLEPLEPKPAAVPSALVVADFQKKEVISASIT